MAKVSRTGRIFLRRVSMSPGDGRVQYEQGQAEKGIDLARLQTETGLTKQDNRMRQGQINQNYSLRWGQTKQD